MKVHRISHNLEYNYGGMVIIALGSNQSGAWKTPRQTLLRAIDEMAASGIQILERSDGYFTRAQSRVPQPNYLNAVVMADTTMPANAILQVLKRIEARAGRAAAKRGEQPINQWKPRPLDLDIISYKGLICNWKMKRPLPGKGLVLPHARAHERAFVLRPLMQVCPHWHHPVFGLTAAALLRRPIVRDTGAVLDSFALRP
jgi:2-amino-4-hydroxy-6-hydroxymethyldihydropteridine diphosphokinase